MYTYRRKYKLDPGSIFFMVLFMLIIIGMSYLLYIDKGKFWDLLPFVSIPVIIISLILIIFNSIRRTKGSAFFILFFILSVVGLILSNIFGPSALNYKAEKSLDNKNYSQSINYYNTLLNNYPNSQLADNALENISSAYYSNNNYMEAIDSFERAIESGIFSKDNLEIKEIIGQCHIKLAQEHYKNKEYGQSAESYLNAVEVLEEIKSGFPDTDEAFIAVYKIPEYLYNAALNFKRTEDWDKLIEVLENLTNNYNDSDYFNDATYLLSEAYNKKAAELIESRNYTEGVEEFLKILDLDNTNYNYKNISDYDKEKIFSDIPPGILRNIADDNYNSRNYIKSLLLYEIIVEYNPQLEEEVYPLLIDSKLNLVASSAYLSFEPPILERRFWGPGKSILIIENNTEFDLTAYLKGPEYKIIKVEKNSTIEIEISSGTYEAVSELNNLNILPYYGNITYEEGQRYRQEYTITR